MRNPGWAGTFFGPLYAELYSKHLLPAARSKREAAFARTLLGLKGKRVLDLAAGFGRHARLLAKDCHVCAFDLNLSYLEQARSADSAAIRNNLTCVGGDMTKLPFADSAFHAVLLLFNSFGYFTPAPAAESAGGVAPQRPMWKLPHVFYEKGLVNEDFGMVRDESPRHGEPLASADMAPAATADPNVRVLEEIARVLRPGGEFLIEVPNPKPLLEEVRRTPRRRILTGRYEIEEEYYWDEDSRVLSNRTRFRAGNREEDGEYRLRLYSVNELKSLLKSCGLRPLKTYGSYVGEPYSARDSDMILIRARGE